MEFNLPTTKLEMHDTLLQIFNYYRSRHDDFNIEEFKQLELNDIVFNQLSDSQLEEKASTLLAPSKKREFDKDYALIQKQIEELEGKVTALNSKKLEELELIEKNYQAEKIKIEKTATEGGIYSSEVLLNNINSLAKRKQDKILSVNSEFKEQISLLNSEISNLREKENSLFEVYDDLYGLETEAKKVELKEEEDRIAREVHKYNNSISEKLQKYNNTLLEARANLELKFLSIQAVDLSKDQLVKLGYYRDVITCITAFYDTKTPIGAYNELLNDTEIIPYIEAYYEQLLLMYKLRAEAQEG